MSLRLMFSYRVSVDYMNKYKSLRANCSRHSCISECVKEKNSTVCK